MSSGPLYSFATSIPRPSNEIPFPYCEAELILKVTSLDVLEIEVCWDESLWTFLFSLNGWFKRANEILWIPGVICCVSFNGADLTCPALPPTPICASVTGLLSI